MEETISIETADTEYIAEMRGLFEKLKNEETSIGALADFEAMARLAGLTDYNDECGTLEEGEKEAVRDLMGWAFEEIRIRMK